MQADAEHQQDDADLGEVIGKFLIGDIARREGADHNPGQQIADQRRDAEAVGDGAQDEGQHQSHDDDRDKGTVGVHRHAPWLRKAGFPGSCRRRSKRSGIDRGTALAPSGVAHLLWRFTTAIKQQAAGRAKRKFGRAAGDAGR
jgi:hypothetical protein